MSDTAWGRLWDPYIDTALGAWDRGDKPRTDKIVSLLLQVLEQGQKYNSVDENLVKGLYSLADRFSQEHEYQRAEWVYLKILESQEEILEPDDPQIVNTLARLSSVVRACNGPLDAATKDDLSTAN